jgi:hypothetical protein
MILRFVTYEMGFDIAMTLAGFEYAAEGAGADVATTLEGFDDAVLETSLMML